MKKIALLSFVGGLFFTAAGQALKVPAPSPVCTFKQSVGLSEITIEYSRPGVKGRTVFGDLVPFGKVWRTGANASTKITFGEEVKLQGNSIPAGTYAFFTIPDKDEWTIIFNKNLTLWGSDGYKSEEDVMRIKVKPVSVKDTIETMTFDITDLSSTSANIIFSWEQIRLVIPIAFEIDSKVMKNIETVMGADKRPYFQSANYYFENGKDLKQALAWVNKAIEQNPKAYWAVMLKARIQIKLKDKTGSNSSAMKVITLAKAEGDDNYIKMAEKLLADNKLVK